MRFAADEMLGKLARWLRVSGLDVSYQRQIDDTSLIDQAHEENRIILTRDTRLIERLQDTEYSFIKHDHIKDQLQQFYGQFPQLRTEENFLSRCIECNTSLQAIDKTAIKDKVWPYVYATQEHFRTCPQCQRVYWQATHVERIKERLRDLLEA